MTELQQIYQSIILDPCHQGQERRNWAAIRKGFEQVADQINNIITINEGDQIGDQLVLFQVLADNIGAPTVGVRQLVWNGSVWLANGEDYTAYDWSEHWIFRRNFYAGMQGIGVRRPLIAEDALVIITLESYARFVAVTLNGTLNKGSSASASVDGYWGAYPNVANPGTSLTIYDDADQSNTLESGDKAIAVFDEVGQKYILLTNKEKDETPTTDEIAVVMINEAGDACTLAPYSGYCVWNGKLQDPVGGATMCGSPWTNGADIWILDIRACSATGSAPRGERYLAWNTGLTFNPGGAGSRPLYAIKTEQVPATGVDVKVIRLEQSGATACDPIAADEANCIWSGYLQIADLGDNPVACDLWEDGAQIWAMATNKCHYKTIRAPQGERFLAVKVAESWGTGDQRPLYAFRHAELTRLAIVEITGTTSIEECEGFECDEDCVWPGKLVRMGLDVDLCEPWEDEDVDCLVIQINACDRESRIKKGERFLGAYLGDSDDETPIPIFAIQAQLMIAHEVRWGKCVTNWYRTGSDCDYIAVRESKDCYGNELVTLDADDPNYQDDFPVAEGQQVKGYKVLLPRPFETGPCRDPNLEVGDVIGYRATSNGKYVCVTDYLDDLIGTVKMSIHPQSNIKHGWAVMNGSDNSEWGSGWDMTSFFPRGVDESPLDPYGDLGETGGREEIPDCDLAHNHIPPDSPDYIDCGYVKKADPEEDPDAVNAQMCKRCLFPEAYDTCERDPELSIVTDGEHRCGPWGEEMQDPEYGPGCYPVHHYCEETFGPLNIVPKYRNLQFIERIDNSQDVT